VTAAGWRLDEVDGVLVLRSGAIESHRGIAHAFSTRVARGRADFDLGPAEDARPEAVGRRMAFLRAAGFGAAEPAILRQVHGAAIVDAAPKLDRPPAADGVIRVAGGPSGAPIPAVRTADCVAMLVADRRARAVAAVHAGWRGIAAGIGSAAVARFAAEGIAAGDLVIAMGPAILGCCYEVGGDVVSALHAVCGTPAAYRGRSASGRTTIDLHAALRGQLATAGVPDASVHAAPFCTRCRNDLFFSFRAEGSAAGRLMAAIGPPGGP
jgi:purine-nucleoside/S-methyl-5'-thioadenosine phosphorylase / adenosine deaminase